MLTLKNITKVYESKTLKVDALKGINLSFRTKEFVSILGPSGCGKTTLLNLIGGLDRYTDGDLIIDGISTKTYHDKEWDTYRNHRIGFVFQNYHLIQHLSVIENVALALTLSGSSRETRLNKAKHALIEVGLEDQLYKKPNQLSGGQQQRVSIARALVNDPDILLADEPTGAIDSKTAEKIMNLLKAISKNRLVIMVTHNPELAKTYSDRIITMLDGLVTEDSMPSEGEQQADAYEMNPKTAMRYVTALGLSFKNLLTKKVRTIITALAGSIGIIGIALILSVSNGFQLYIRDVQQELLSAVPITIDETTLVLPDTLPTGPPIFNDNNPAALFPDDSFVTPFTPVERTSNYTHFNVLTNEYMTYLEKLDNTLYQEMTYQYDIDPLLIRQVNESYQRIFSGSIQMRQLNVDEIELLENQYDVLSGRYPNRDALEMVIVVSNRNQLRDFVLKNLGFVDEKDQLLEEVSFETLSNLTFKLVHSGIYYEEGGDGFFDTNAKDAYLHPDAVEMNIVGILRIKEGVETPLLREGFGYSQAVSDYILENSAHAPIVEALEASLAEGNITGTYQRVTRDDTYDSRNQIITDIHRLGGTQFPTNITIYANDFEAKESIAAYLSAYNEQFEDDEFYLKIIHTDFTQTFTSYLSQIVNNITYLLVGLSGISLIVSSVLIGIITYVSVIERTKEIGILRAIGARKKDITRVFNAETIIIGFLSGTFGIIVTLILNPIINGIIENLAEIKDLAILNPATAILLIVLSVALTLIAGFIPAKIASRKDPVVALRTE